MDLQLKDKVIMVAAGSKGLGFGIAEACARDGAIVCIASRSQENVDAAVAKLASYSGVAHGSIVDARSRESIQAWADEVLGHFGRIDGLVINAGGPPAGRFDDFNEQQWYDAFELTLMSAVRMIHAVLPTMRQQGSGALLTVTSLSVKEPIDTILLSNVMRSGVVSLVKSLSKDIASEGIRINNLVPGTIYTDRVVSLNQSRSKMTGIPAEEIKVQAEAAIPMGRYGTPEEFGAAGAFLLSDAASYISGATLVVDGALSKTVW
ncbi:MAG: SDR family oxidoreductase [Anaerolineales bacterium]|nr:SDR family oxidoreductase [Anaerolineales bacterium]MCB0007712.1 SDR family oxidoreductase [Anaerolineales bacterium]MCB0012782.1 SDR family oxidoreductase [Anaerolineales bacterium]MCB0018123.1 SDR family oxidoreductase [Anaerolineales bacterium]MCB8961086.1 SDR family oxidoreductase [Ardenticatenales bacterium]